MPEKKIVMRSQSALDSVLDEIRAKGLPVRVMGEYFERLVKIFLKNDPVYESLYADVYLWREWCKERGIEIAQDTGIDLVAVYHDGRAVAIQAKFYQEDAHVDKKGIDSFLAASGNALYDERMIVSTTYSWSKHADNALRDQTKKCVRIGLNDLRASPIDWRALYENRSASIKKNSPFPHQKKAIQDVCKGLEKNDRGKLIMACGTGKTYVSLKIAEQIAPKGHVLFLVPSLSLLSQVLREWSRQSERPLRKFIVCSDSYAGNRDEEDISLHEMPYPATTSPEVLASQMHSKRGAELGSMTVVFCTYHSIDVLATAQEKYGCPLFDLIVCDEAHRTAGAEKIGKDGEKEASYYVKVHDSGYVKASKRLYMTATPRIYKNESVRKAREEHDVNVYSMDKEENYGKELHRLGFSEAVDKKLLSDYKVIVLGVTTEVASKIMPVVGKDDSGALNLDDSAKLIGCYNALAKRIDSPDGTPLSAEERKPMRRAVAYASSIKNSKSIAVAFNATLDGRPETGGNELKCEAHHVDGTMNSLERDRNLQWLRESENNDGKRDVCRILFNAKCLSEGVDVPALDAVMFLNPRKSQIDVVQAVGRVMRKAEGKQYGYVILPVVLPDQMKPEETLNKDTNAYKVVWQVLQALRSHDENFDKMINSMELNQRRPDKIMVQFVGAGSGFESRAGSAGQALRQLNLDLGEKWYEEILGRIVKTCGSREYWGEWAKSVGEIARRNIAYIRDLLRNRDGEARIQFDRFLRKLQKNLNPSVSEEDAIEMLSQHLITRPVFDALFERYDFAKKNPVSRSMDLMIKLLGRQGLEKEIERLGEFYDSVRRRAQGVDNISGKQTIMTELYEKFFSTAFKKHTDKLGIVYTPVEVVDFILHSADYALRKEFNCSLSDEKVHILDPFAGTGTFVARLLHKDNDIIKQKDLWRKYESELHTNEIMLLAYYIAAINVEEAFHSRMQGEYTPFDGITLTDTFLMGEVEGTLSDDFLYQNSIRAKKQGEKPIKVIIGNPPYSAGQRRADDNNPNELYPKLTKRIIDTYSKDGSATLKRALHDSYVRAIRWASDRIKGNGIVAFVTNGSFIDGNATDGMRKHLLKDFSSVYCFNLRGNIRMSGCAQKREGGNIFGRSSRVPVAITILIKKPAHDTGIGKLYYCDIGDYLSSSEKLEIINKFQHYGNIKWRHIRPNLEHDWINQRNPNFMKHVPMGDYATKGKGGGNAIFNLYSRGLATAIDGRVYGFSPDSVSVRMKRMITFYNKQVERIAETGKFEDDMYDKKQISWGGDLKTHAMKGKKGKHDRANIRPAMYRPFTKQRLYFDRLFIQRVYCMPSIFPSSSAKNLTIVVPGIGSANSFSALMTDTMPDLGVISPAQCFPLYHYSEKSSADFSTSKKQQHAFESKGTKWLDNGGERRENITDAALRQFQDAFNPPPPRLRKKTFFTMSTAFCIPHNTGSNMPRI